MGIKQREDGTWEAFFSKRHPVTLQPRNLRRIKIKTEAEARKVERELVAQLEQSFLESVIPTWPKIANQFMESKRLTDWTDKTYLNCKLCLEAHTFDKWRKRRIDSITPQDIKSLLVEKVGERSPSSQQTLLKFIRGTFQFAVDSRILPSNPSPNIRFKIGDKAKKVLTEEQVRILLSKAKEFESPWYYHWAFALYTGMRNGELYSLSWDKVNLQNRTILVDSSWNRFDGFKDTKSGDDRIVEIAPNLGLIIKELKIQNYDSHFVLPRSRDWEKGEQARCLRMFLQGIGLPSVRFHDLRASWATIMLGKGVEPIKVMNMGGWKNIDTMMIYIRKAGINIRGITDNLDLHNPSRESAKILQFGGSVVSRSDEGSGHE